MLQAQARTVLTDLRASIARCGYDASEKRHLSMLFGDLRYLYGDTRRDKTFSQAKHKAVADLETRWQKDRQNDSAGADSIHEILTTIRHRTECVLSNDRHTN